MEEIKKEKKIRTKCIYCKKPIHISKWGGAIGKGFFCNNIVCLIKMKEDSQVNVK